MAKLSLKELKKMIREAVRESLEEQISGLPGVSGRRGGYMGGTAGRPERMGAMTVASDEGVDLGNFDLNELIAMMKDNPGLDDKAKGKIKKRILELLKAAGW